MFEKLIEEMKRENTNYMNRAIARFTESEHKETALRDASTGTRWNQYQAGQITREKAVELATKRLEKEYSKREQRKAGQIAAAAAAEEVKAITIFIEWKKSRTWGYNPTVIARVETENSIEKYTGTASGCGYDKRSAAVADALNKCPAVMKALYSAKEAALANGWKPSNESGSNASCIEYGAGYGALPYLEGGVGMSSLESVFNKCGLLTRIRDESGAKTDYYYFERA